MTFRQKFDYEYCAGSIILELVASKWAVVVLQYIKKNTKVRFNDLFRDIPKLSEKVLAQTLDLLEWNGLVKKTVYMEASPRTEYEVMPLGDSLLPLLDSLRGGATTTSMPYWLTEKVGSILRGKALCDKCYKVCAEVLV